MNEIMPSYSVGFDASPRKVQTKGQPMQNNPFRVWTGLFSLLSPI